MSRRRQVASSNIAFVDMMFLLFMTALLFVNDPAEGIDLERYVLIVQWTEGANDDIDTYVRGPDGQVLWFRNKTLTYMFLDRDDLGRTRDDSDLNMEVTSITAPPDGTFHVSVHNYRAGMGRPKVTVTLFDERFQILRTVTVPAPADKEETPIMAFDAVDGRLINARPSAVGIVRETRP